MGLMRLNGSVSPIELKTHSILSDLQIITMISGAYIESRMAMFGR